MEYKEEDYLQLSGIQHFIFCSRQWALIHIEQLWADNLRTVEGEIMHKHAHDTSFIEKRKDVIISRGLPVFSRTMGISGQCDIVEFHKDPCGVDIAGREGKYRVVPVEYKKGIPKEGNEDVLQLTAQAMCLEEMMLCKIPKGYLYYGEPKRRIEVLISEELREQVKTAFEEMHRLYDRKYTPKTKMKKCCNACSIKDLCLPKQFMKHSVSRYIQSRIDEVEYEEIT